MSSSEMISYAMEYKNIVKEMDGLNNDIKKYRQRLKPRILELQKEKEKYEKIILEYLEKQDDPGFKYQDIVFYKEPQKKYTPSKEREEQLQSILNENNILDTNIVNKIKGLLKTKKVVDDTTFTLKVKKLV